MSIDYSLLIKESVAPLALVSGVGLVLLVVNARFMHVSDRLRSQLAASRGPSTAEENRWLFKRARWLRLSLLCLSGSILSTSFLVFCALWSRMVDEPHTAAVLFLVLSTGLIGAGAWFFALDVFRSLDALRIAYIAADSQEGL